VVTGQMHDGPDLLTDAQRLFVALKPGQPGAVPVLEAVDRAVAKAAAPGSRGRAFAGVLIERE
jgi:hypothetical protein